MMISIGSLLLLFLAFSLATCKSPEPNACPAGGTLEDLKQSEHGLTEFSIHFYRNVSAGLPNKNAIISPISVAFALAILGNGANGTTREKIKRVLIGNGTQNGLLKSIRIISKQLQINDENTKLNIANGLFFQKNFPLKPEFKDWTKNCFDSEIETKDFANQLEKTRKEINQWISGKTNQKIPELFKDGVLSRDVALVLANAIYFKSAWNDVFQIDQTNPETFYKFGRENEKQNVPFMRNSALYGYASQDNFEVLKMPYQNPNISMYIFLPKSRDGLRNLEGNLTAELFKNAISKVQTDRLLLIMPPFTVRSPVDLKGTLSSMGLDIIFSDSATFERISNVPLKVSKAKHEAFIKVNENGTEAAAATGFSITPRSGPTRTVIVDHPFLYAIVHDPTDTIIFIGKVNYIDDKEH